MTDMETRVTPSPHTWRRKLSPPGLRALTVTYSVMDLLGVAVIAAVVSLWAAAAGGAFSMRLFVACELMFFGFYLAGSVIAAIPALRSGVLFELPLRLLVGYGAINTALLVLAWLSPLGMVGNGAILLGLSALAFFTVGARRREGSSAASGWAVGLCLLATTLWCQDCLDPRVEGDEFTLFKPWIDGFYHSVHIRIFAQSHGASTVEDFRMAGVPARLYHYGVYMLPAWLRQVSAIDSYTAFAGILVPVGVLFTGLGAYSFFGSLWGAWPGLAAAAALLLVPDGYQQGMQNPFLSYHFLTHISPSATVGLALLAVAWLFVLLGCVQANRTKLMAGWFCAGVVGLYKLHYVIASGFLLLLVPALFFGKGRHHARQRVSWLVGAAGVYFLALFFGQQVPGVPRIVFDGSSVGEILHLMSSFALPGPEKEQLVEHVGRQAYWWSNLAWGIPYVLFAALGLFIPLVVLLAVVLRKRVPGLYVWFPLLLVANFLAMFFGLALDMDSSTPDELSHRPVMIVYFFVAAWVGGAFGWWLQSARLKSKLARPLLLALAGLLMVVPARLGEGVQLMWVMRDLSPVRLPRGLVQVAEYMRTHGDQEDLFQDSQFDRFYALAALSERRPFVSHTLTIMPFRADEVARRSAAVDRIMAMDNAKLVLGTARAYGLRWFVRYRGNRLRWPPELGDQMVLEAGPFSLYDLK